MLARLLVVLASAVALVLLGWGLLHVVISPVHPDQPAPEEHVQSSCWACHFVSASAELIED